ncbi:Vacuolar atpase assembly integral membrane protein vma21-like domain-containing protein [Thalictrum thalictroides]|uniref:Vacuolar ATPase assembly integral membrane protein VMA21 homolog n=1 Tax=Thalictrum thalictroides TaxID=46969 RepID=A0A7J6USX1_THATH|nr:Vacuolar atpase assembly integral membrane protein vma21-like domain-containing protein [Thalictrum thalictroides]
MEGFGIRVPIEGSSCEHLRKRVPMAEVIKKFFIASMFMWIVPIAILYGFNHSIFPGSTQLSSQSQTLVSGFLAVISVNIVIAFYICMAMKEPTDRHVPDPAFLAEAKASIRNSTPSENEESSEDRDKQE